MSDISDEKHPDTPTIAGVPAHHMDMKERELDAAAAYASDREYTPAENKALLRRIDKHLLPMMMLLYLIQFWDKTTLGSSVLLGVKVDNHLSQSQYNWLSTIFYLSYLLFEWPQNLALQRFPVGKWMSANILFWSVILMCHAACRNFAGLFVVRFLLGVAEGSITAGFMIVTSMFYTKTEQAQRVGMWFLMNGTAQLFNGLVAFGIYQMKHPLIPKWEVLFLLTGGITFFLGIAFWFFFPNSSTTAWFLSEEERIQAVNRIKENQTGVENKVWKMNQFWEALTDVKVWLFTLFALLDNVPNSLTNQASTIYTELGFPTLISTVLGIPSGVIEIITISSGIYFLGKYPNQRAWISIIYFIPNIIGPVMIIALSQTEWTDAGRKAILGGIYLSGFGTTGFVISLAWLQATTAGHTKKTTAMAMNLIGYCVGNIIGPQVWQAKYSPKNVIPWSIVLACYTLCPFIMYLIRSLLVRENLRRDRAKLDAQQNGTHDEEVVEVKHSDGTATVERVDVAFLDLTDKQNQAFRYCL